MTDHLDKIARSCNMSRIRSKNTRAELIVRRIAHALGYRFRLHRKDLPGNPDLVFPSYRLAVFVNGCFWHRHAGCGRATTPKTHVEFWESKFRRTTERDQKAMIGLYKLGWRVSIIWECQTRHHDEVRQILQNHLSTHQK
jgi:DNA mismatch endonuclease (patch repair protein)